MQKLKAALYGTNGHQIHDALASNWLAEIVAVAEFPLKKAGGGEIRVHRDLDDLLADPEVDFVSLCSPCRRDQATDAIKALRAGKHVYAEKPCAMTEPDLDAILRAADETGCHFREMTGTAFDPPYFAMREIVRADRIGEIVQVIAGKSYPYHDGRPQDEDIDGGLIGQNAIHAVRFVEHVACATIRSIRAWETSAGNPIDGGGLRMAAGFICELENGGLASLTANYLNPRGTTLWGYDSLQILGTLGMVESTQGGRHTRLVVGDRDFGPLPVETLGISHLDAFLKTILGHGEMPLTLENELRPTRWVIRAKALATGM